jgi:hypothetical protein
MPPAELSAEGIAFDHASVPYAEGPIAAISSWYL